MKKNKLIYGLVLLAFCTTACEKKIKSTKTKDSISTIAINNSVRDEFPEEIPLNDLKETEFVLTLENKLSDSNNSIYTPAFLFAWQEIKDYYKSPIDVASSNSLDFKLINQSNTFQNSLNKGEYITTVDVGDGVAASAYFQKYLPFAVKFHIPETALNFNGNKIRSFGLDYPDHLLLSYFEILYYLDDNHFTIKLFPADTTSEIILTKGINLSGTFSDLLNNTNAWIKLGSNEKKTQAKAWRYAFEYKDHLSIPVIKFNIGTNYSTLEGQSFTSGSKPHGIVLAYQRAAFVFDEYGAEVESYGYAVTDSIGAEPIEKPKPKNMIFDKPFVIFIKKKNISNPYFAMKVMNAELMEEK